VCRFHIAARKAKLGRGVYKMFRAIAKLAGITFSRLSPSYWTNYLGFITKGKLAAIFIKPSLGVSNWPVIFTSSTNANKFSGTIITTPSIVDEQLVVFVGEHLLYLLYCLCIICLCCNNN
jgi:hypothetical protein